MTDAPLIAILEDEPDIRRIMSDTLEAAGFRTMGFSRATEFEAALRRITPDACLVDLGLPDRDGLALVHRLATESGAALITITHDPNIAALARRHFRLDKGTLTVADDATAGLAEFAEAVR